MSELKKVLDSLYIPIRPELALEFNCLYAWRFTCPWQEMMEKEKFEPCELGTVYCLQFKNEKYKIIHRTNKGEDVEIRRFETACDAIVFAIENQNIDESMQNAFDEFTAA